MQVVALVVVVGDGGVRLVEADQVVQDPGLLGHFICSEDTAQPVGQVGQTLHVRAALPVPEPLQQRAQLLIIERAIAVGQAIGQRDGLIHCLRGVMTVVH